MTDLAKKCLEKIKLNLNEDGFFPCCKFPELTADERNAVLAELIAEGYLSANSCAVGKNGIQGQVINKN